MTPKVILVNVSLITVFLLMAVLVAFIALQVALEVTIPCFNGAPSFAISFVPAPSICGGAGGKFVGFIGTVFLAGFGVVNSIYLINKAVQNFRWFRLHFK